MHRFRTLTMMLIMIAAFGIAGCGGGGGGTTAAEEEAMKTPEEIAAEMRAAAMATCESAGGRFNDDGSCTSAEELVQERIDEAVQAEKDRVAAEQAEQERVAAEKAMAVTAAKLYGGIGTTPLARSGAGTRSAAYSGTNDADITVSVGDPAETQVLKATKDTIAANHGWEGKKYTASGTGVDGTYEAVVYSNVGAATQGKKFGNAEQGTQYQYPLTGGMLTIDASSTAAHAARVGGSGFDHTAGVKTFPFPSPNRDGATKVSVPGSFHGVSGTYTCTPGTGNTCAALKATKGFTLGTTDSSNVFSASDTAWTFRPGNPEARVSDVADFDYSSYGWWLQKDGKWTASAFTDDKGTAPTAISGLDSLNGTATYMGGAAGKYAISSSTGGTNDAGHFTARATLEANFNDDTITGTVDRFMGADGKSRDWSVELKKSHIGGDGVLVGTPDGTTATTARQETVWSIDGTKATAGGGWSGALKDTAITTADPSGVPKIATGTFDAVYNNTGLMVGAFGATRK